jgi:hypothetical protein
VTTDLSGQRAELYALLDEEAPEITSKRSGWERVAPLGGRDDIVLVFSLSQDKASVYLKALTPAAAAWVRDRTDVLGRALRTSPGHGSGQAEKGYWFRKDNPNACFTIRRHWPEAIRWFRAQYALFDKAVTELEDVT